MVGLVWIMVGVANAQVDQAYTTAAGGAWSNSSTWSKPAADVPDYPTSGDTVTAWDDTVSVNAAQTFSGGDSPGKHTFVSLSDTLIDGYTLADGDLFGILDADGGLSGTFAGLPEGAAVYTSGVTTLSITYQGLITDSTVAETGGNDVVLIAAIPEPASALLVALGGLLMLRRRPIATD